MHPIHSLNDLELRTNPELLALYADLRVLLSSCNFTDVDRLAVRTILSNIRLVLNRRTRWSAPML